jgi:hypothetical protein
MLDDANEPVARSAAANDGAHFVRRGNRASQTAQGKSRAMRRRLLRSIHVGSRTRRRAHDLMAERIALTVASLQRTASLTDLDHDAEIARWELRNVHAGGGGAHAIGNALRQSAAGGKAPTTDHRRQATDIGAVDALIASECESKCFVRIVVGNNGSQMRAVRVRIQSQQPQIRAKDYYFVFILFIFQTFCFTHQLFLPSGRCFIGSSFG